MASRALIDRFSTALSSWLGSQSVGHRSSASTVSSAIAGPTVRRISSSMPATSRLGSVGTGASVWRRENASSRWVSAAARVTAPRAAAM